MCFGKAVVTLDGVGSIEPTGNFVATSLLREELNVFLFDHSECMKSSGFASDFYTSFTQGLSSHRPKVGFLDAVTFNETVEFTSRFQDDNVYMDLFNLKKCNSA